MIYGIGIDVAPLARIKRAAAKQHFIDYVLTPREREQYDALPSPKRQVEYFAGRFSAKESYSKALGTGIGKSVGFHDLTVLNDKAGKPYFAAHPRKGVFYRVHQTRRNLLCRSKPGGRIRTGWHPACFDCSKRYGQQIQSYCHMCCHNISDKQGEAADAY